MIKQTINFSQFCDSFSETYRNNFSYKGKKALFEYLEALSEDMGEDIELDTVALCCEYTEYDSLKDIKDNYTNIKDIEELKDNTQVIEIEDSEALIIQDF